MNIPRSSSSFTRDPDRPGTKLIPAAAGILLAVVIPRGPLAGQEQDSFFLHSFERQMLVDDYYSEGIGAGDLNRDGSIDIVHGPFWFEGPSYSTRHMIYAALPQPRDFYADNFFSWVYDFNGDAWPDVFTVGFPGKPAHVYQNPGPGGFEERWRKHEVFDSVCNESPHLTDLVGDERPELVCTRDGYFGFATVNWRQPFETWTFHPISDQIAPKPFGHGLGVGDVNGDGRRDILMQVGWFEQPAEDPENSKWTFHEARFAPSGGAEMYAYDVDGDGDSDVITSLAAHEFGLAWFEQIEGPDGGIAFREHRIMGDRPSHNRYGVLFTELHSVSLADIDGDGLRDIVTGKTYWSHHRKSPMWDAGAVVYWFRLVRGEDGVDWVPHLADGESGIGRQLVVADVDGDSLPDILAGGMKGAHLLRHRRRSASEAEWKSVQPKPVEFDEDAEVPPVRGEPAPIEAGSGKVPGALEGEAMAIEVSSGEVRPQEMKGFRGGRWSGDSQIFWTGGGQGDAMTIELTVDEAGVYALETVFTCAPDYAIVQLALDGIKLGDPVDLFEPSGVTSSGVLRQGDIELDRGAHTLTVEIAGANPRAAQNMYLGLDYLRLVGN